MQTGNTNLPSRSLSKDEQNFLVQVILNLTYFLLYSALLYEGSTPIFRETNCVCDSFQCPCQFGNHILPSAVDVMCAVLLCVKRKKKSTTANAWNF